MPAELPRLDAGVERQLAAGLFNQMWVLLDKLDRSAGDDDQMVHTAHASRYHWSAAGGPVQWARGEWQCSRVYAVLGRAEPALHHARRCLELATDMIWGHSTWVLLMRRSPAATGSSAIRERRPSMWPWPGRSQPALPIPAIGPSSIATWPAWPECTPPPRRLSATRMPIPGVSCQSAAQARHDSGRLPVLQTISRRCSAGNDSTRSWLICR
jgi:hypothetical protein